MGALIAIAGIITPLGLYETLVPTDNVQTPFQYLKGSLHLAERTRDGAEKLVAPEFVAPS